MVTRIFLGYRNHYNVNPLFNIDLTEAYKEWARSFGDESAKPKNGWIVKRDCKPIGFATCSFENDYCEGVLYGVIPEEAGGGIYSDLIRFTQNYYKHLEFKQMKVSTQVNNFAVQKVWSREGFIMTEAFLTVHVNSLMKVSRIKMKKYDDKLTFLNKVFSDQSDYLKIQNECLITTIQLLEEAFPEKKVVVKKGNYIQLRKINLKSKYVIVMEFPILDMVAESGKVRFTIFGPEKKLHLIHYIDFRLA